MCVYAGMNVWDKSYCSLLNLVAKLHRNQIHYEVCKFFSVYKNATSLISHFHQEVIVSMYHLFLSNKITVKAKKNCVHNLEEHFISHYLVFIIELICCWLNLHSRLKQTNVYWVWIYELFLVKVQVFVLCSLDLPVYICTIPPWTNVWYISVRFHLGPCMIYICTIPPWTNVWLLTTVTYCILLLVNVTNCDI